jgi:hypothetical protein
MNLMPFQFEKSELWDETLHQLDTFIETDTLIALDVNTLGELRVHAAGRASALVDFKNHLVWLRHTAIEKQS